MCFSVIQALLTVLEYSFFVTASHTFIWENFHCFTHTHTSILMAVTVSVVTVLVQPTLEVNPGTVWFESPVQEDGVCMYTLGILSRFVYIL